MDGDTGGLYEVDHPRSHTRGVKTQTSPTAASPDLANPDLAERGLVSSGGAPGVSSIAADPPLRTPPAFDSRPNPLDLLASSKPSPRAASWCSCARLLLECCVRRRRGILIALVVIDVVINVVLLASASLACQLRLVLLFGCAFALPVSIVLAWQVVAVLAERDQLRQRPTLEAQKALKDEISGLLDACAKRSSEPVRLQSAVVTECAMSDLRSCGADRDLVDPKVIASLSTLSHQGTDRDPVLVFGTKSKQSKLGHEYNSDDALYETQMTEPRDLPDSDFFSTRGRVFAAFPSMASDYTSKRADIETAEAAVSPIRGMQTTPTSSRVAVHTTETAISPIKIAHFLSSVDAEMQTELTGDLIDPQLFSRRKSVTASELFLRSSVTSSIISSHSFASGLFPQRSISCPVLLEESQDTLESEAEGSAHDVENEEDADACVRICRRKCAKKLSLPMARKRVGFHRWSRRTPNFREKLYSKKRKSEIRRYCSFDVLDTRTSADAVAIGSHIFEKALLQSQQNEEDGVNQRLLTQTNGSSFSESQEQGARLYASRDPKDHAGAHTKGEPEYNDQSAVDFELEIPFSQIPIAMLPRTDLVPPTPLPTPPCSPWKFHSQEQGSVPKTEEQPFESLVPGSLLESMLQRLTIKDDIIAALKPMSPCKEDLVERDRVRSNSKLIGNSDSPAQHALNQKNRRSRAKVPYQWQPRPNSVSSHRMRLLLEEARTTLLVYRKKLSEEQAQRKALTANLSEMTTQVQLLRVLLAVFAHHLEQNGIPLAELPQGVFP